jgi:PAS domain S-box-containing protein
MSPEELAAGCLPLESVPYGVLVLEREGIIRLANRRLGTMVGWDPADLVGQSIDRLLPERLRAVARGVFLETSPAALGQGRSLSIQRKDGAELPVEVSVSSTSGEQPRRVAYLTDLTLRKQLELERTKAVLDAARAFTDKIEDPPELANTIARTCVHLVGDFGAIRLTRDGGEWLDIAAVYHANSDRESESSEYLKIAEPLRVGAGPAGRVVADNKALLWRQVKAESLLAQAVPRHRDFVRSLAVQSLLIVPLRARGTILGCITVARVEGGKPFDEEDLELLQLVADSAGVAIYNARIFGNLLRAQTAVRQLQEANARQAEISATMLRNIPGAAVFLLDREQRFLSAQGSSVVQLLGMPAEEAVGRTATEVLPELYRSEALSAIAETLAGKLVSFQAVRGERTYEVRCAPIFSGSALAGAALVQLYDITERVQQEQERRHERERFRALMDHVPVGVFDFDPAGTARFTNDKFLELLGLPAAEAANLEQRARWVHPEDLAALRAAAENASGEGRPFRSVFRFQPTGKPARRLLMQCVPLRHEDGALRSFVGILEDITLEFDAAERTSRSLREKETLLAEIHHRVKNNLQVITSIINLQARRVDGEKVRAIFDDVRGRIQAIALLHERMYSSPDLSAIDIVEYFQGLLIGGAHVVGADAGSARVHGENSPLYLPIERAMPLGLLVNELVTNAFKYGRRGRAGAAVEVRVEHDVKRACITVSDDGYGFGEGFDPDKTHTLGLYLVQQLARQLDGTIRYLQHPTRCVLEFPVIEA